jgi:hypothetical protein
VGKGGPDGSIDTRRQIRRAHQQRRGGHGGTRAVPYRHASAAFAHPTTPRAWQLIRFMESML